jgi:hypothetical protein
MTQNDGDLEGATLRESFGLFQEHKEKGACLKLALPWKRRGSTKFHNTRQNVHV